MCCSTAYSSTEGAYLPCPGHTASLCQHDTNLGLLTLTPTLSSVVKRSVSTDPAKLTPTPPLLLLGPLVVSAHSAVPFLGRKEVQGLRDFLIRGDPSTLPVQQVFIVYSMPSFALESTTLRPMVCREEEVCYELNVCVSPHTLHNSYVEALIRM